MRSSSWWEEMMQHSGPLHRLEREIQLPSRRRLELLEELDADLAALSDALASRGVKRRRADQLALESLLPGRDVLDHLEAQHATAGARWLREARWAVQAERAALFLAAAAPAGLALWGVRGTAGVTTASLLIVCELALIAALGVNWLSTGVRLWVRGDLRAAGRRAAWRRHAGLMIAALAVGALGSAWAGYDLLGGIGSEMGPFSGWTTVRNSLALATLGTAAAIFGLFGWLALTPRLVTDEVIEKRIADLFRPSDLIDIR